MLFMEKTMEQIYRKEFPHGSHSVYGEYGINRDLVLSSYHYGSDVEDFWGNDCLLYTSPSPRDKRQSRMPSSA